MTPLARALGFIPHATLAFRAETAIHVVLLTKAADVQVWASIHAGWAAFSIDHGSRTALGWKNKKDTRSYLSVKSIIPEKPQIIHPTPFKSVVSQARFHMAKHVHLILNCFPWFLYLLLLVSNRSSYSHLLQHQISGFLNGNRICCKRFLKSKNTRRRKQGELNNFLHYWYEIFVHRQFCKEVMNLNFMELHPWNI